MNEPAWFKVLNLDEKHFERSKYAAPLSSDSPGKFRLKDLNILRKLAPGLYEDAANEAKEYKDYLADHGDGKFKKTRLGKKIGSIHTWDAALHPELMHDAEARKKYWQEHPEYKY